MENHSERLVRYLQDAHAAETGIEEMLKDAAGTDDADAARLFEEHLTVTRSQTARLEQRLQELGGDTSGGKGMMNKVMAKVGDVLNMGHDKYDKTTQDLIKAYATEHLEMAMYEALIVYAEAAGDMQTAALAREIQDEERQTAERIFPMIEAFSRRTYTATSAAA